MRKAPSTAALVARWVPFAPFALAACAGSSTAPMTTEDGRPRFDLAELTAFEIRHDNIDRFEHCPPSGDIGQEWLPPLTDWKPAAVALQPESPQATQGDGSASADPAATEVRPANLRELESDAERSTHLAFRRCYHDGLRYDPTQDGHVAVVLRVGAKGKVEAVETWGACDIAPETITCIRDTAKHLGLPPPAAGYATVVVPGVFTEGLARARTSNDAFTAAAYVAVETVRPQLHRCEEVAKRSSAPLFARATITIDVDAKGRALHLQVGDGWKGNQALLACAAEALQEAKYPAPRTGQGRVIAPIVFNPKLAPL